VFVLHQCPPPVDELRRWLRLDARVNGNYGHTLLEQITPIDAQLEQGLRPYFESAHADARRVFHETARIDLHPDADAPGAHATYPACLPATAKKGLFGEVMAGLMVEALEIVGNHRWSIPVYLFRYHTQVGSYIFNLARDPERVRQISGRHGNDFIGLCIDPQSGEVVRFIAGEAKWRATLTPAVMDDMMLGPWIGEGAARARSNRGVWNDINTAIPVPEGIEQISKLLREIAPDQFADAILSLDRALLIGAAPLPRTDYIFVAGNKANARQDGQAYLPRDAAPDAYAAGRALHVIELVVQDGGPFVERLYASLWDGR
jgi:hypothetical protein